MPAPVSAVPRGGWADYYAARKAVTADAPRSPLAASGRPAPTGAPGREVLAATVAEVEEAVKVEEEGEVAAQKVAAAPGSPELPPVFLSPAQQEERVRTLLRARRRSLLRLVGGVLSFLLLVPIAINNVILRSPREAQMAVESRALAKAILSLYSTPAQPFELEDTVLTLTDRDDQTHLRFEAVVTLRVYDDLYAPAWTNGTEAYTRLQQSLSQARNLALSLPLPIGQLPTEPEMPALLQVVHPAGTVLTVTLPVLAQRSNWHWGFPAPDYNQRVASLSVRGEILGRFNPDCLVFGTPASILDVHARMAAAIAYISAVQSAARQAPLAATPVSAPPETAPPPRLHH